MSNKSKTKTCSEVLVFENSISDNIIFQCSTKSELDSFCESHDQTIFADQISVNGIIMYGWDEIDDMKYWKTAERAAMATAVFGQTK